MAIILKGQPTSVVWSRNPILFEFETNNRYAVIGQQFNAELNFNNGVAINNTMTLTWNNTSHIFTFVAIPDDSGTQLSSIKINQQVGDWVVQLVVELKSYFPLSTDFEISQNGQKVVFTAKSKLVNNTITFHSTSSAASYMIVNVAIVEKLRENFAFFIEIMLENEVGLFESFTQSVIEVDSKNTALWDIQEYITTAMLGNGEARPNLSVPEIYLEKKSVKRFYIRYAEMYGSPQIMQKLHQTDIYMGILGGVDESGMSPMDYFDGLNKWMAHKDQKTILANQPDFASIINFAHDYTAVKVMARIYYADGQIKVSQIPGSYDWRLGSKLIVPVGIPDLKRMLQLDLSQVVSFNIWLENAAGRISYTYTLNINNRHFQYPQILLFLNSLGCFESIFTTGKSEFDYEIEKNNDVFEPRFNSTKIDPQNREMDLSLTDEIKINSGYFDKKTIGRFRDFILSRNKFLLKSAGFVPVIIDSSTIKEFEDGNNLHAINFTLKHANEQLLYSEPWV